MTKAERANWLDNIYSTADAVAKQTSWETVMSVLQRYGASSIEDLNPSNNPEVFSELYAIEADTRD